MARVTVAEVKEIVPGTTLSDAAITSLINVANITVNKLSTKCGSGLTEEELTSVELYLSAHLVSVSDPESSIKSEKFENASTVYNTALSGEGIKGTPYGNTANMLSGGCLVEMDKRKAGLFAVGRA